MTTVQKAKIENQEILEFGTHYFATKKEAETFAIAATGFSGGQYRITPIFVNETEEVAK